MTPSILQLIALIATGLIFWRAEPVLNLMGPRCRVSVRIAFWLLAVGAVALLVAITQGYRPDPSVVLLLAGTALLLASERRIKSLVRTYTPTPLAERRTR